MENKICKFARQLEIEKQSHSFSTKNQRKDVKTVRKSHIEIQILDSSCNLRHLHRFCGRSLLAETSAAEKRDIRAAGQDHRP